MLLIVSSVFTYAFFDIWDLLPSEGKNFFFCKFTYWFTEGSQVFALSPALPHLLSLPLRPPSATLCFPTPQMPPSRWRRGQWCGASPQSRAAGGTEVLSAHSYLKLWHVWSLIFTITLWIAGWGFSFLQKRVSSTRRRFSPVTQPVTTGPDARAPRATAARC